MQDGGAQKLEKAKITLNDCLACSGCITSAESVLITQQSHEELCKMLTFNKVGDKSWLGRLQSLKVLIDWCDASAEACVETARIKISFRDLKDLRTFSGHCCVFSNL